MPKSPSIRTNQNRPLPLIPLITITPSRQRRAGSPAPSVARSSADDPEHYIDIDRVHDLSVRESQAVSTYVNDGHLAVSTYVNDVQCHAPVSTYVNDGHCHAADLEPKPSPSTSYYNVGRTAAAAAAGVTAKRTVTNPRFDAEDYLNPKSVSKLV